MALETATYIDGLVSTNPTSSDNVSQGDDHIRLLKATIKATFPNLTGAVTPTQTDLNKLTSSGSPQFSTIELGAVSDTTISRSAAGVIAVEGGVIPKENRSNTFTAGQSISTGAATAAFTLNADAGQFKTLTAASGGLARWILGSDSVTEAGSNAGSNFFINRYTDAGGSLGTPLSINRATGLTTLTSLNVPTIDLGNTDTTISRVSAGLIAVEGSNVPLEDRANTFTDAQTINQGASGATLNLTGDAGTNRALNFRSAGTLRWIVMAHSTSETGSNAGTDFKIRRLSDAGATLADSINISRATGLTTLEALTVTGDITANGSCLVKTTGGLGYGSGSGGAVTQATSRTTGVTLNKTNGAITLVSAAGSTTWQSFTVTNSTVAATDTVVVSQKSGTDLYEAHVTSVAAGSFRISFRTTAGTTTEQPVFNFAVIKAVTA